MALILRMIEAFKVFDIIYVMTRGGPADTTKIGQLLRLSGILRYLRAGSGASYAVTVALTSAVMIAIYIMLLRRAGSRRHEIGAAIRRRDIVPTVLTYAAVWCWW